MYDTIEAKVTHRFRASPERVFDAFVDPVLARRWQAAWLRRNGESGNMTEVELDPRVGGRLILGDGHHSAHARHWGKFMALERPTKIAFSWMTSNEEVDDPDMVNLIIEPEPDGPGSVVTLYNTLHAEDEEGLAETERGWMAMLGGIEDVIERRDVPSLS